MSKSDIKIKTSKRNFIIALILLVLTNIMTSVILMYMSKKSLREQIDQRMLDIANTAAYQLDGDELKNLTAEDEGTEEYERALETLRAFQENIQLDYIYGIKAEDDGTFTFSIDPTVEDPGEFGAPIETTEALKKAAKGTPSVDKEAYSDDWGTFYSAYSPVFDSENNVVGIVGVDFNAEWYDGKLRSNVAVSLIILMIAITIGGTLAFTIMSQNRRRFTAMLETVTELDKDMQKLDDIIMQSSIKKLDLLPTSESDLLRTLASGEAEKKPIHNEYDELSTCIDSVNEKLHKYLKYVDSEVHIDGTTGVFNKVAYKQKIKELDDSIKAGSADFSVAFFDINDIKTIFTNFGYEAGDTLMFECAKMLKNVFGKKNVYHIMGDEFIVLIDNKSRFDMEELLSGFDEELKKYNSGHDKDSRLSVAKGSATYSSEQHEHYRQVFIDAKAVCDKDKAEYYQRRGR